ncbi:hypothetical protein EVAR_23191_1 [Eumeta japonica]|uniref:Uncharacterized protein n=1 Tax=Eumeta variegata TaxID=151549 RepID=A0A4C1VE53_EUMVA|nr:hypothetical protein EVAR_23191_1 [Eumeta japonica]
MRAGQPLLTGLTNDNPIRVLTDKGSYHSLQAVRDSPSWKSRRHAYVVCGRCLSSTRTHRPMEWERDRSFRALARTLGSGGTRQCVMLFPSNPVAWRGTSRSRVVTKRAPVRATAVNKCRHLHARRQKGVDIGSVRTYPGDVAPSVINYHGGGGPPAGGDVMLIHFYVLYLLSAETF